MSNTAKPQNFTFSDTSFFLTLAFVCVAFSLMLFSCHQTKSELIGRFVAQQEKPIDISDLDHIFAQHLISKAARSYANCANRSTSENHNCSEEAVARVIRERVLLSPTQGRASLSVFANYGYPIPEAFREEAVLPLDQALAMLQDSPTVSR